MVTRSVDLVRSADLVVRELLALKAGERFAIVADPMSAPEMVDALAGVAAAIGAEFAVLTQPTRPLTRKNELSPMVEAALERADALVGITASGGAPTYSKAVKRLMDAKRLRVISMVMRDVEIFTRGGALADYKQLFTEGQRLADLWRQGGVMRITTPAGTDLRASVAHDDVIVECGYATEAGQEAAFSDGEVSSRPHEGEAEGVIVVDGPMAVLGTLSRPISLTIARGKVTKVEGEGTEMIELRRIIETVNNADNIAEFGIGLNPLSLRNGRFEEEKKARGNVHVAIGDDIFYGGSTESPVHIDMVMYMPTVTLDRRVLVKDGQLRL